MNRPKRKRTKNNDYPGNQKSVPDNQTQDNFRSVCPICNSEKNRIVCENNTFIRQCLKCGSVFNDNHRELDYGDDYFISQYRNQYGKTYLDDYQQIYTGAFARLKKIFRLIGFRKNLKDKFILDIGSAMGFFLKAAKDNGIGNAEGVEISKYASDYCYERYNIPTVNTGFLGTKFSRKYSIITAWYFFEHCDNPAAAIKIIFDLLDSGGIFAFSMPSINGPMFRFNREKWCETHPADHRIDLSPSTVKFFLKKSGFSKIKVFPAGIHPERIVSSKSFFFRLFSFFYGFYSHLAIFSDTMEIYAKK